MSKTKPGVGVLWKLHSYNERQREQQGMNRPTDYSVLDKLLTIALLIAVPLTVLFWVFYWIALFVSKHPAISEFLWNIYYFIGG